MAASGLASGWRASAAAALAFLFLAAAGTQPARAAGCPAGYFEAAEYTTETGDAIVHHHVCMPTTSPCATAAAAPSRPDTVNPGMMVTPDQCESAYRRLVRLGQVRQRCTSELDKIQKWGSGLNRDEREFEQMRIEAQTDLAWEFIDHVPVAEALDALKAKQVLKAIDLDKIKIAFEATRSVLETGRGLSEKQQEEAGHEIVDGNRALHDALIDMAGLSEEDKRLLDAASKIISYGAQATISASAEKMSDREKLQTVMMLVEILEPWWGLGVLAEHGFERGTEGYAANKALESLHEAQSANWNAKRYWTDKLEQENEAALNDWHLVAQYQAGRSR